ncbi:alpha mannosidase-like protein [Ceratobasidium sp. 392]|nr:alpha mannosidase-like protein [Ceratobasidium sp. 392]
MPWSELVDFGPVQKELGLDLIFTHGSQTPHQFLRQIGVQNESIAFLKDKEPYQYLIHDSLNKRELTGPGLRYQDEWHLDYLREVLSSTKALHFGTLFGTGRLKLQNSAYTTVRAKIRSTMVISHPGVLDAANTIRSKIVSLTEDNTSYLAVHVRVGGRKFKPDAKENGRLIWWELITSLGISQETGIELEHQFLRAHKKNAKPPVPPDPTFSPKSLLFNSTKAHISPSGKIACPSLLSSHTHSGPTASNLDVPLFIATDAPNPRAHSSLAIFYATFPCVFTLSDFRQELDLLNAFRDVDGLPIGHNDVMANFSLTLVDNLDSFVAFNNYSGFEWAVRQTIDVVSFDQDAKPQVFEITIRGMGGLLSAHMFASDLVGQWGFGLPWYRDELLHLAHDLGKRLLPAFNTSTGIPFARINLRHGVPPKETFETCTAGAGSLLLEFTTLSRLTGDPRFEQVARKAFFAVWNRRSDLGLVPNTINLATGRWLQPEIAGIGAGIDSFYEYALKMYVMTGESEYYDVWQEGYTQIMRYSRGPEGFWYRNVGATTGQLATVYVDSLSAFWPGLQVLAGDVQNAIKSHLVYWNLWRRFSGIPETFNIASRAGVTLGYPLRPEFIESTYFLYRATGDAFYLDVGERVLLDLIRRAKVECGLSTLSNVQTGEHEDRMESFALSETLKYLYLLFDEDNKINSDHSNLVFTTEGHPISLPRHHLKPASATSRYFRQKEQNFCPVYRPARNPPDLFPGESYGLIQSIRSRPDAEYGRFITGLDPSVVAPFDERWWDVFGWCEVPQAEEYVSTTVSQTQSQSPFDFDFDDLAARLSELLGVSSSKPEQSFDYVLSIDGSVTEADKNLGPSKVHRVEGGFMVRNITGIKARMTARMDGQGYDVTMLGHHRVLSGQRVFISDPALLEIPGFAKSDKKQPRKLAVQLHLKNPATSEELYLFATTALFGADPEEDSGPAAFRVGFTSLPVVATSTENLDGCSSHAGRQEVPGAVLVVNRGSCTFMEKLQRAKEVGAAGVIVVSDNDGFMNPSVDGEEQEHADAELADVALVAITRTEGHKLFKMLKSVEGKATNLMVEVERQPLLENEIAKEEEKPRLLYINGKALLNTEPDNAEAVEDVALEEARDNAHAVEDSGSSTRRVPDVVVFDERNGTSTQPVGRGKKGFMSSKIAHIIEAPNPTQAGLAPEGDVESEEEQSNTRNDKLLHELVHSQLLNNTQAYSHGQGSAERSRTVVGRLVELADGAKVGRGAASLVTKEQARHAQRVRIGLREKAKQREAKALEEAKALGNYHPSIKRNFATSSSKAAKQRREKGLALGVGKFRNGALALSQADLRSVQGPSDRSAKGGKGKRR